MRCKNRIPHGTDARCWGCQCNSCGRPMGYGLNNDRLCKDCPVYDWHLTAYSDHLMELAEEVNSLFYAEYASLGSGWSRKTYCLGNGKVAKVPYASRSNSKYVRTHFYANIEEHELSQNGHPEGYPCAKTFGIEDWFGVPVLIMEKVTKLWGDDIPDWADEISHELRRQMGANADGEAVLYDFATNTDPQTGELSDAVI